MNSFGKQETRVKPYKSNSSMNTSIQFSMHGDFEPMNGLYPLMLNVSFGDYHDVALIFTRTEPVTSSSDIGTSVQLIGRSSKTSPKWDIIPNTNTFTHSIKCTEEFDNYQTCQSLAISPTSDDIYMWTLDPPTLYHLRTDLTLVRTMELPFKPVNKDFGYQMYFSKDGKFLYVVSRCPWDHYEIHLPLWKITRRGKRITTTQDCIFMIPLNEIHLIDETGRIMPGDSDGTVFSFNKFGAFEIQKYDGTSRKFQIDNVFSIYIPNIDITYHETMIIPINQKGNRQFQLLLMTIVRKARGRGRVPIYKYFNNIWELLGIDCEKFNDLPLANPRFVTQIPDKNGNFNDSEEDSNFIMGYGQESNHINVSIDMHGFSPLTPPAGLPLPTSFDSIEIEGETFILYQIDPRGQEKIILNPVSLEIMRIIADKPWQLNRLFSSSKTSLKWDNFLFSAPILQNIISLEYPGLPENHDIDASIRNQHSSKSFWMSGFGKIGLDICDVIFCNYNLTIKDLIRLCIAVPYLRPIAFRSNSRRMQLRSKFVDLEWVKTRGTADKSRFHVLSNSLLLFLVSLKDEEALVLIAESCYFKTRKEYRKDQNRALSYLKAICPPSSTGRYILKGKDEQVVSIDIESLINS
jgi:hypothetical protein